MCNWGRMYLWMVPNSVVLLIPEQMRVSRDVSVSPDSEK